MKTKTKLITFILLSLYLALMTFSIICSYRNYFEKDPLYFFIINILFILASSNLIIDTIIKVIKKGKN